ncbi:hypothetical protein DL95DRAFT_454378 [Leptodontidium sp. 2 PMI_412]|nr:hypothetical protein DL95DRAFT_454378 [Leptodontidium sp. 2 PMI_412]
MADPFSIVSVVVIALKAIHTTKDYVETICRAPRSVSALAVDLADIESFLRQLSQIAQDERPDDSEMHQFLSRPIATWIETSSVASEDIHGRTFEHIERWNLETQTIVEEDTELSASISQQVPPSFAPPETPQNHSTNYNIARPLTGSSVSSIDYIPPASLQDYSKKHSAPTPPVIPPNEEALAETNAKQGLRFFSIKNRVTPLSPKKTESKK